jgi:heme-degrading monooxygenase HmoA
VIVSVTRLQLRSPRFLLLFAWHAHRSRRQAEAAEGCLHVAVRKTAGLAFWTLTAWRDEASLRAYMRAAPHRWAVPKLARWCDEAAVTHWEQDPGQEPVQAFGWDAAAERLIREGRLLKVLHPSESQRQGVISIR